jgi:hypothetical protein
VKISPKRADFLNLLKPVLKPGDWYLKRNQFEISQSERKNAMKNKFALFVMNAQKVNRQHVQLFFVVLALATLVLGLSAPVDGGGVGR